MIMIFHAYFIKTYYPIILAFVLLMVMKRNHILFRWIGDY